MKAIPGKHIRKITEGGGGKILSGGKTDYVLLLPEDGAEFTLAADELTEIFYRASGIKLPRVTDDGKFDGKCISLGGTSVAKNVTAPHAEYGESGYRIKSVGTSYALAGGKLGVLYAAYDLMGILFGFKTFSDKTERLNRATELDFVRIDVSEVPDFRYRSPSHAYIKYNERLKNRLRMTDLEDIIGGEGGPYHNNFNFVPPHKFAALHPKWYSDDGSQMCYTAHGDRHELDLLTDEAAHAIERYIRQNPDMPYIAFNHQDNFDWCTCPACTALKERYGGADSGSAVIFLGRVRARLQELFDMHGNVYDKGQRLVFFAYHGTNQPPVRYDESTDTFAPIDDDVMLRGVIPWFAETNADYTVPLTEGEVNAPVARNLRGWKALGGEMLFWTYGTNFENYLAPYYSFAATPETYKFAKRNGAGMLYDECQINTDASTAWEELKGFLSAQLSWNVDQDVDTLTAEFFDASYGSAAPRMLKVFDDYKRRGEQQIGLGYSGWRSEFVDPVNPQMWDKQQLLDWEAEMTAAINDVADSENREVLTRNIVLERASVRYLICEVFADTFDSGELAARRKAAADDLRASKINMFNEKKHISTLFEKWGV